MVRVSMCLLLLTTFAACTDARAGRAPSMPAAAPPAAQAPAAPPTATPTVAPPHEPAEPAASGSGAPAPAPAAPATGTKSCSGPTNPALTRERIWNMLQGDDDFPQAEIVALAPGVVPALVELASAPPNDLGRYRAITLLGNIRCRDTAPFVAALLRDPDSSVRLYATTAIGEILGADATPPLAGALSDTDTGVLKFALKTLATVGDARATSALERFIASSPPPWLRERATLALAAVRKRPAPR